MRTKRNKQQRRQRLWCRWSRKTLDWFPGCDVDMSLGNSTQALLEAGDGIGSNPYAATKPSVRQRVDIRQYSVEVESPGGGGGPLFSSFYCVRLPHLQPSEDFTGLHRSGIIPWMFLFIRLRLGPESLLWD